MNVWSEFKSCFKIWMANWIFCLISHNRIFIKSYLSVWISGGFVWIFDLLSHIAQWNFHSELLISMDLYGSLISMDFSTDMNSSLVLLKLDWCQVESFVTYLTMQFCLLFHSKLLATQVLSFQIQMSNWNFSCISQNEILLALSFKAMNFWKEFKFCFQI